MKQLITDFYKLPISNDFLFKHVLLIKPICKHILEELFHTEIADITYIFLNTKGTKGKVSSDIQSLFDYINNNVITSSFTQEVADTIVNIKNDKKVRSAYMTYEMRMKDLRNEAFYEGEAKGETKEKFATVKRMLKRGKSTLAEIAEYTELPLATVQKIQAEMQTA